MWRRDIKKRLSSIRRSHRHSTMDYDPQFLVRVDYEYDDEERTIEGPDLRDGIELEQIRPSTSQPSQCAPEPRDHQMSLEVRLKNITYEGWLHALDAIREVWNFDYIRGMTNFIGHLTKEEKSCYMDTKHGMPEKIIFFRNIIFQRPDTAGQFLQALKSLNIQTLTRYIIPSFEARILSMNHEYFERPSNETLDISNIDAWSSTLRQNSERIKSLAIWISNPLYQDRIIDAKEQENMDSSKDHSQNKEEYLVDLLSKRTEDQRRNFIQLLEKLNLLELKQTLLADTTVDRRGSIVETGRSFIPYIDDIVIRERYTQRLQNLLSEWSSIPLNTTYCRALIHGPNGVGKTAILAHVVQEAKRFGFTDVLWVVKGCLDDIKVVENIFFQLKLDDEKLDVSNYDALPRQIEKNLQKMAKRIILVLDDLTKTDLMPVINVFQFVMVTSINSEIMNDQMTRDKCVPIKVKRFSNEDCKNLLQKISSLPPDKEASIFQPALDICHDCQNSPHVTRLIGNYIRDQNNWKDNENAFIENLREKFSNFKDFPPTKSSAWKIAYDSLSEEERNRYLTLTIFANGPIFPATLETIWTLSRLDVNDILQKFSISGLIDKHTYAGRRKEYGYSLTIIQRYFLNREKNDIDQDIEKSVLKAYKDIQPEKISEEDCFYFANIIEVCLLLKDCGRALQLLSNFRFLSKRLKVNAGQNILRDFIETGKRAAELPNAFKEMWYLCHLVVPQILNNGSPTLLKRAAILQRHKCFSCSSYEKSSRDHHYWAFDEPPDTEIQSWTPPTIRRKLNVRTAEVFTKRSFATTMDVSRDGKWIVVGCNRGTLHVFCGKRFYVLDTKWTTAFIFLVRFISPNRFVVVSNTAILFYYIEPDGMKYSLKNETRDKGISIINDELHNVDFEDFLQLSLQPVSANEKYVWVMTALHIECLPFDSENLNLDEKSIEELKVDGEDRIPHLYICANQDKKKYAAATNGKNLVIMKMNPRNQTIDTKTIQRVNDCKIVAFVNDKLVYTHSQSNSVQVCSRWQLSEHELQFTTVTTDFIPDFLSEIPATNVMIYGASGGSCNLIDIAKQRKKVKLPVDQVTVVRVKSHGCESYIYTCSSEGNVSKIFYKEDIFSDISIHSSVPRNAVCQNRYLTKLQLFWNFLTRQSSTAVKKLLFIKWIDQLEDFLAISVDSSEGESRRNELRFSLLRQKRKLYSSTRRCAELEPFDSIRCWFDNERIILYNNRCLLQFQPIDEPARIRVSDIKWNPESKCDILGSCGGSRDLVAITDNGELNLYDGEKWIYQIDVNFGKWITLVGLKNSRLLLGVYVRRDNQIHTLVSLLVDSDSMSLRNHVKDIAENIQFQVSNDESHCAVVHKNRNEVAIYNLPDLNHVRTTNIPYVRSISFHPHHDLSHLYITYFNELSKQLVLRIWRYGEMDEIKNDIDLVEEHSASLFEAPEKLTEFKSVFISDCSYYLVITDSKMIIVYLKRSNTKTQTEIAFDTSWTHIKKSSIREGYVGADGQFICISTEDNETYVLRSIRPP